MDSPDIVDDVNALLKLGVGDAYRLEHIKQSYIDNKTIWITDANYLEKMREKYLVKHKTGEPGGEGEEEAEKDEDVHCWKCGKKNPLRANFCMGCGSSIFDVGAEEVPAAKETPYTPQTSRRPHRPRSRGMPSPKLLIVIGVPALALVLLGGAYGLGYLDGVMEMRAAPPDAPRVPDPPVDTGDSRCGPGTVFDEASNSCVLP